MLWRALATKYGSPGIQHMYIEFKGMMEVRIPDNGDPFPAIDKLLAHFTRLREFGLSLPEPVQVMMLLAKALRNMESVLRFQDSFRPLEPPFQVSPRPTLNHALYSGFDPHSDIPPLRNPQPLDNPRPLDSP